MNLRSVAARLTFTVLSLLAFLTVLHAAFYAMPGDPVRALFGLRSPGPALVNELRATFHLDDPYPVQLWRYLSGLVTGDLGPVYRLSPNGLSATSSSVGGVIRGALPHTMSLVGLAIVLQALVGTVLTVKLSELSGRRYLAVKAFVAVLIAVPAFLIAAVFEVMAPGLAGAAELLAGAAALAAVPAGMVALVGGPMVRDVRREAFTRRARASGITEGRVRWLHTLRPAMGLVASLMAAETGNLLTAAVVVEPVLGRHGLGAVLINALNTRQGPTLLAVVGVSFGIVAVMNFIGDALATTLDPRVQSI